MTTTLEDEFMTHAATKVLIFFFIFVLVLAYGMYDLALGTKRSVIKINFASLIKTTGMNVKISR